MHDTSTGAGPRRQHGHEHEHHSERGGPRGARGERGERRRHSGFGRWGIDGPPGAMGRRGSRGRRTDRGDIRMAVLALIAEQPRHGYEIIQAVEERSGGNWKPSPGSIYPTVAQLEDEGLLDTEKVEGRRMATLTAAGTAYVEEHRTEIDGVWDKAGGSVDEPTQQLRAEVHQLVAAVGQVAGIGGQEQIQATVTVLAEARKTIYRLLAE